MTNGETFAAILVTQDGRKIQVTAGVRAVDGRSRLLFYVPSGNVWADDVVVLIVDAPSPRVISARVLSRTMIKAGKRADRIEAVVEDEQVTRPTP